MGNEISRCAEAAAKMKAADRAASSADLKTRADLEYKLDAEDNRHVEQMEVLCVEAGVKYKQEETKQMMAVFECLKERDTATIQVSVQ